MKQGLPGRWSDVNTSTVQLNCVYKGRCITNHCFGIRRPYQKSCVDGPHLIGDLTELQGLTSPRGRTQQRAKSLVKKLPWQLTEDAEPTLGRTHPSRGASSLHTVHIYTKSTNLSMLKAYKPCYKL
ncbi:10917_t:CDS:2 [Funneliformis geosporum]|uniref:10917_t:CDS:1 n=1 Tax=Funneliformis geosporum TaxID=1117311 RepID=A0A9W4T2S2_9GLOM|nr:10917_t:CDS:2 [Funneliformis geosporum]